MLDAATYCAVETLRDGREFAIRAFRPEDRDHLISVLPRVGAQSLYRRFFTVKREFSDREREFFLNVDFVDHVALMAWVEEAGRMALVGGARYVVLAPDRAEIAFVVIDEYQGQGIGSALLRHLAVIARAKGIREFDAEVLPENAPMLKVFEKSGLPMTMRRDLEVVHVGLRLG